MINTPQICSYYQANLKKADCWFVTAVLKECDHLSLDRTINVEDCLYEFFVPVSQEELFLSLMNYFVEQRLVYSLQKLPNRLLDSTQQL